MKSRVYFILICFFTCTVCVAQEVENTRTAKIDVSKQIKIVTKGDIYNTYRLKDFVNKKAPEIIEHPKLFIDIPIKLAFKFYDFRGKVGTYIFSDSIRYIFVEIHYSGDQSINELISDVYQNQESNPLNMLTKHKKENLLCGLYFGIHSRKNVVVYYYNVKKTDLELFNKSIQSIRFKY